MLKAILSDETCAKCRGCCYFDKSDMWEVPLLTEETAKIIHERYENVDLESYGSFYSFSIPHLSGDELFTCPMLTDTGCCLGNDKPFDCKIWPFRIMKNSNDIVSVAVSKYCKPVSSIKKEELENFLKDSGLIKKLMKYKDEHPESIKEFSEEYIFLNI